MWLTEMDLQLTNVEHFSESDADDKMRQLNVRPASLAPQKNALLHRRAGQTQTSPDTLIADSRIVKAARLQPPVSCRVITSKNTVPYSRGVTGTRLFILCHL